MRNIPDNVQKVLSHQEVGVLDAFHTAQIQAKFDDKDWNFLSISELDGTTYFLTQKF